MNIQRIGLAQILRGRTLMTAMAIMVLAMGGCSSARKAVAGPPVVYRGAPTNVQEFDVDGLHVILRPTGPSNHVVAARLFIRGGLTAMPAELSPAVEDLALEIPPISGPQWMDKIDYQRLLQKMVTNISGDNGRDFSTMSLRCVDEKFDTSWALFTGVILQPRFDSVELRNAKGRSITALRNRNVNPEAYAGYLADSVFFAGHPYGRFAHEEDIAPLDGAFLENYYKGLFVKSRLFLVVVGNVDSADIYQKVASTLGKLPQGDYQDPEVPVPANAFRSSITVRQPAGALPPTNYIVARYLAPNRTDSLYYPFLRLTSFLSGALFREVRIERNLSYAPDADANFGSTSYGQITVSTTLPDSTWRVMKNSVIDFFRGYVIADEYMKAGLSSWITSNYLREQTNELQANELGVAQFYTGSWSNAFRTYDAIRTMTSDEMNLAAQFYLRNFTVVIVGDSSIINKAQYLPQQAPAPAGEELEGGSSGTGAAAHHE
jgi:predicted Zn-dependent peptidase